MAYHVTVFKFMLGSWAMFFMDVTAPLRSFGVGTWLISEDSGDHYPAVELGYRHLRRAREGAVGHDFNKQVFEKS